MPVDTFSGAVFASVHTGETANHACQYFLQAFSSLDVPLEVKTDNDSASTAKKNGHIFNRLWCSPHFWNSLLSHESSNYSKNTLHSKTHFRPIEGGSRIDTTDEVEQSFIHFKFFEQLFCRTWIFRHFSDNTHAKLKENPPVLIGNPKTGQIECPFQLIIWVKGYACLSTGAGSNWVPAKNVKQYHLHGHMDTYKSREMSTQTWAKQRDYSSHLAFPVPLVKPTTHEFYAHVKSVGTVGFVELSWKKRGIHCVHHRVRKSSSIELVKVKLPLLFIAYKSWKM